MLPVVGPADAAAPAELPGVGGRPAPLPAAARVLTLTAHRHGRVLVVSAGLAWYVAAAMVLAVSFGRTVLPLLKYGRSANVPGRRMTRPIELEWAEPGVRQGQ